MSPRLVPCTCDADWPAMAVCVDCERRQLHQLLVRRGVVRDTTVDRAFAALVASYERSEG